MEHTRSSSTRMEPYLTSPFSQFILALVTAGHSLGAEVDSGGRWVTLGDLCMTTWMISLKVLQISLKMLTMSDASFSFIVYFLIFTQQVDSFRLLPLRIVPNHSNKHRRYIMSGTFLLFCYYSAVVLGKTELYISVILGEAVVLVDISVILGEAVVLVDISVILVEAVVLLDISVVLGEGVVVIVIVDLLEVDLLVVFGRLVVVLDFFLNFFLFFLFKIFFMHFLFFLLFF